MEDYLTLLNGLLTAGPQGLELYNQIKNNDALYLEKVKKAEEEAQKQKTLFYISLAVIFLLILILVSKLYKKN